MVTDVHVDKRGGVDRFNAVELYDRWFLSYSPNKTTFELDGQRRWIRTGGPNDPDRRRTRWCDARQPRWTDEEQSAPASPSRSDEELSRRHGVDVVHQALTRRRDDIAK
jgi:hypothetical protein